MKPRRQPTDLPVPRGIAIEAERIGARAYAVGELVCVVLGDGRECWLNRQGEQVGRAPGGRRVAILDDVPWGFASITERTSAA